MVSKMPNASYILKKNIKYFIHEFQNKIKLFSILNVQIA